MWNEALAHRISFKIKYPKRRIKKLDVCHHCDNPPCCRPSHLFRGTALDNARDCCMKGRQNKGNNISGDEHYAAKLRNRDVLKIRKLLKKKSPREIATMFNIKRDCVYKIVAGTSYRHVR